LKAAAVLVFTGLLGLVVGIFRVPSLQVAVESAQVVAGIVQYPPGNAFYIYHTKLWTLLHQAGALLLVAGVSELALSRSISGLLGMMAFQALGMSVYALSRHVSLAIAASIVIVLTGVAEGIAVYPVTLMGTSDTYGAVGLSLFVLVLALFGAGCQRGAAFLLGLAPAVHAGLGVWLWCVVLGVLWWEGRSRLADRRPALTFFVAGAALSALSLFVQLAFITDVPAVDPREAARDLDAFVSFWDYHRAPLSLLTRPMLVNIASMAVAAIGLTALGHRLLPGMSFFLKSILVCGVFGIIAVLVSWIPPQHVPFVLLTLMPARLLTVNTMVLAAIAIGLSSLLPRARFTPVVPALILAACFVYKPLLVLERAQLASWTTILEDYSNDPFFAAVAAETQGLVATGGSLHLIQLRSRRPVLLDGGGLDGLPYAPESGPEMRRVLADVYGLDLMNPPEEARHSGVVPDDFNKAVWTGYSNERWRQMRRAHNVTQVVTRTDWTLDLPLVTENGDLRLYRIPE
jgi:hypothetical protein